MVRTHDRIRRSFVEAASASPAAAAAETAPLRPFPGDPLSAPRRRPRAPSRRPPRAYPAEKAHRRSPSPSRPTPPAAFFVFSFFVFPRSPRSRAVPPLSSRGRARTPPRVRSFAPVPRHFCPRSSPADSVRHPRSARNASPPGPRPPPPRRRRARVSRRRTKAAARRGWRTNSSPRTRTCSSRPRIRRRLPDRRARTCASAPRGTRDASRPSPRTRGSRRACVWRFRRRARASREPPGGRASPGTPRRARQPKASWRTSRRVFAVRGAARGESGVSARGGVGVVSVPRSRRFAALSRDETRRENGARHVRSRAPRRIAFVATPFGRAERHGARRSTDESPV